MTDRELLELAAKAAGIRLHVWGTKGEENFADLDTHARWNPLTDDGDALRLAVKLGIHQTNSHTDAWATTVGVTAIEPLGNDPYAATRLAITRAAAQLAKGAEK